MNNEANKQENKTKAKKKNGVNYYLRLILAFTIWTYYPIKAFVYDFDLVLMNILAPEYLWIIHFRLVWFVLIALISLIIMGGKEFTKTVFYIIFFPITFFFGEILKILWRYSGILLKLFKGDIFSLLLFVGNYFVDIKKYFRIRVLFLLLLLFTISCIFIFDNKIIYILSIFYFILYLGVHYALKIHAIISPTTLFSFINDQIKKSKTRIPASNAKKKKDIRNIYEGKKLDFLVFWYYLLGFTKRRVAAFTHSPKILFYYVLSLIYSIVLTLVIFSLIYYSIYNIDPNSFAYENECSLISFAILSANSLVGAETNILRPVDELPSAFIALERLLGWLIGLIYITILFIIIIKHYNYTVNSIVKHLDTELTSIENYMLNTHNVSIAEAKKQLKENKDTVVPAIEYFESEE